MARKQLGVSGGALVRSPLESLVGVPFSQEALLSSKISYPEAASRDCVPRCRDSGIRRPRGPVLCWVALVGTRLLLSEVWLPVVKEV